MPWVKLTDDWYDDERIIAAGPDGLAMWVVGLTWSARNLTDGHIPSRQVRRLLDFDDPQVIADRLTNLGLWRQVDAGYEVANYHRYQPTKSSVLADRERDRQRKSSPAGRKAKGFQTESGGNPNAPVPVPVTGTRSSSLEPVDNLRSDVDDALQIFVERKLATLNGQVTNVAPWKRKVLANARVELAEQAGTWLDTYDVTPTQIADALVAGTVPASWNTCRKATP